MNEYLLLKWGTLKDWTIKSEKSFEILDKYCKLGHNPSCMMQKDTPEQKRLICELIDSLDGTIQNDWSGDYMTKQEAKDYVMEYGTNS